MLTGNGNISDFMLYTLGLRSANEFDDMVKKFAAEEEVTAPDNIEQPTYDDILGITFKAGAGHGLPRARRRVQRVERARRTTPTTCATW